MERGLVEDWPEKCFARFPLAGGVRARIDGHNTRNSRASSPSHEYLRSDGIPMRIAQHLISGGTQTQAPPSIAAPRASNAVKIFRAKRKTKLLPLNPPHCPPKPIAIKKECEHHITFHPSNSRV